MAATWTSDELDTFAEYTQPDDTAQLPIEDICKELTEGKNGKCFAIGPACSADFNKNIGTKFRPKPTRCLFFGPDANESSNNYCHFLKSLPEETVRVGTHDLEFRSFYHLYLSTQFYLLADRCLHLPDEATKLELYTKYMGYAAAIRLTPDAATAQCLSKALLGRLTEKMCLSISPYAANKQLKPGTADSRLSYALRVALHSLMSIEDFRHGLMQTGDKYLIYRDQDCFLGYTKDSKGQNWVGRLCMDIRAEFAQEDDGDMSEQAQDSDPFFEASSRLSDMGFDDRDMDVDGDNTKVASGDAMDIDGGNPTDNNRGKPTNIDGDEMSSTPRATNGQLGNLSLNSRLDNGEGPSSRGPGRTSVTPSPAPVGNEDEIGTGTKGSTSQKRKRTSNAAPQNGRKRYKSQAHVEDEDDASVTNAGTAAKGKAKATDSGPRQRAPKTPAGGRKARKTTRKDDADAEYFPDPDTDPSTGGVATPNIVTVGADKKKKPPYTPWKNKPVTMFLEKYEKFKRYGVFDRAYPSMEYDNSFWLS